MFGFVFDIVNKVVDSVIDAFTTDNNKTNNNVAGRTQQPGSKVTTSTNTNRGSSTPSSNNKPTNTTNTNTNTNKTNNNTAGRTHKPGSNVTTSTNTNRGTSTPNSGKGTSSNKTNANTFGGTKIQNTVMLNKKEYDVYKMNDGTYYIIKDGQKKQLYGGMQLFADLQNEDPWCVNITDANLVDGGKTTVSTAPNTSNGGTGSTGSGTTSNKTPTSNGTSSNTSGNGGGGSSNSGGSSSNSGGTKTETPVEKPVYEGAEAVAKANGIDYNLANILSDYNQRTNDYYDAATAEYDADRTRYVQASNNYANRIMEEYLDSYANAAATASGRGTQAAAALITDLNTQSEVAANDFGMLQTVNNLNEARKAELVNNKFLAEQYYNDLGTYLSQVSTAQYGADVNKYVKSMDAYAQRYAADRALAENEARAASVKYAGLANAAATKSSNVSSTAAWDRLYNYYLVRYNGNEEMASNAVINNLGNQKAGDK